MMGETGAEMERGRGVRFPLDVGILLGLFVGVLFYFQYTTLDKFRVLKPAVRYVVSRDVLNYIQSQVLLTVWDAIGLGVIVSLFLCGVGLEIWRGRLTQMM
ncbi:MAG: hypothetical protein ACO36I_25540, partial [Candidatus Latescibacterota bacterium]